MTLIITSEHNGDADKWINCGGFVYFQAVICDDIQMYSQLSLLVKTENRIILIFLLGYFPLCFPFILFCYNITPDFAS